MKDERLKMNMKKIMMVVTMLYMCIAADARIPDFPDYIDGQGLLYKEFRDDRTNEDIPGHKGEVQLWGFEDRDDKVVEKFEKLKVLRVPAVVKARRIDGQKTETLRVTAIDGHAFRGMPNLEEIFLPEGITYINPFALGDIPAKIIHIPASMKKLYMSSFKSYNSKWEKVLIAKNHPTHCDVNGVVYTKDKKTLCVCPKQHREKVIIPATVREIADEAFEEAANIKTITLPNGVVKVGKSAFYDSNIESITLPATLKEMGKNSLNCCKQLKTIRCKAATPPAVAEDHLWGLQLDTLTVYIPKGSTELYRQADWWKNIKNYVEE